MAKSFKMETAWDDLSVADFSETEAETQVRPAPGPVDAKVPDGDEIAEFADYRVEDWVYSRPVPLEGGMAFAVYAADGTFLEMVYSRGEVLVAAHEFDMEVISVH